MTATLRHRGPDSSGTWIDAEAGLALGHTRLAILDLTDAGHQPMVSEDGRWVLVYNGEIYNHGDLRDELDARGVRFRGHSDTEVLLAAVATWGVEEAVPRLNGMFAAALWDRRDRALFLIRDPLGQKPLYWGRYGDTILFGSEIKAVRRHPAFAGDIDRDALAAYMCFNYVPAPRSIYRGLNKVEPGCRVRIGSDGSIDMSRYWSLDQVAAAPVARRESGAGLKVRLDRVLRDSVRRHSVSDVPVGVLLSGGIDSSLISALMQAQSGQTIKTFTARFEDPLLNEADHAAQVAKHLGTEHIELTVDSTAARDVVPRLSEIYDEPFADSSQVPTALISVLVRQHVTVVLSGDGADELFGGYQRYFAALVGGHATAAPAPLRAMAAWAIRVAMAERFTGFLNHLPSVGSFKITPHRMRKALRLFDGSPFLEIYRSMQAHWDPPEAIVRQGRETLHPLHRSFAPPPQRDRLALMQYLDMRGYLPDDILVKVDRASMAASLELRAPYLDKNVVEFAWTLPLDAKARRGKGKRILRDVLYDYVPRELVDRPKQGFGAPIGRWMVGPLRPWAEDLLDPVAMKAEGFIDPAPVQECWKQHLSGQADWQYALWTVLMFQQWLRHGGASSSVRDRAA